MKKTSALIACLLLILQVAGAGAHDMLPYTEPNGAYRLSYPADWVVVDQESIAILQEDMASGKLPTKGALADMINQNQRFTYETPTTVFGEIGTGIKLIITCEENPSYAGLSLEAFLAQIVGPLAEQLQQRNRNIEFLDPGSVLSIGENTFSHLSGIVPIDGVTCQQEQYHYLKGSLMFCLTFNHQLEEGRLPDSAQALMNQMLASFEVL